MAQKECSYAQTGSHWLAACWDAVRHRRDFGSCVCLVLSRIWLRLACLWLWVLPVDLTLVLRDQVCVWRRFLSPTSLGLARLGVSGLGMGRAALGWLATLVGLLVHADGPGFERACPEVIPVPDLAVAMRPRRPSGAQVIVAAASSLPRFEIKAASPIVRVSYLRSPSGRLAARRNRARAWAACRRPIGRPAAAFAWPSWNQVLSDGLAGGLGSVAHTKLALGFLEM